ncbi:MAG: MATE family efflux transporter [Desulfurococcaceae archaeon]
MFQTQKSITLKYRDEILNGPVITIFLKLGLPLLLVRLVQDVYLLVDMFWLSRYNQYDMAVPRQVMPSYMLYNVFIMSFSSANLALLSQYVGAKMYSEVSTTFRKMLYLSLLGGVLSGVAFYFTAPSLFTYFIQVPDEILIDVIGYAQVLAFDIMIQGFNIALVTLIQSMGDTRTTAAAQVSGGLANVILDPIFINGIGPLPAMGAVGAALATMLSKFVSIGIMINKLKKQYPWIKLGLDFTLDASYVSLTMRIAAPLLVMGISNSLAFNLQNRLVNMFGVIAATAFSLGFMLFDLANTALWSLTDGISIMVGQTLGAGDSRRAKVIAWKTTLFIFTVVAFSSVIIYLTKNYIAGVFITGEGLTPEHVLKIYEEYDKFVNTTIWTLAFFAITFSGMSIGRGSGHTLMPTVINMVRLWGFRIALGYILALLLGLGTMGIYMAFALSNVIGGLASFAWIIMGTWAKPVIRGLNSDSVQH